MPMMALNHLYTYAGGDPLRRIDPDGRVWGYVAVAAIVAGSVAAAMCIITVYDCVRQCPQRCPIPKDDSDPEQDNQRIRWIEKCKADCVKAVGGICKFGPW